MYNAEAERTTLLVSYGYPPLGTPGAMRAAKFAEYLPEFGWSPGVLTSRAGYARSGEGLEGAALPRGIYRAPDIGGVKGAAAAGMRIAPTKTARRIARIVKTALIPDKDITWFAPAVIEGRRALKEITPDVIWSTSPSITNHLVAMTLSKSVGTPWVADFRDLWVSSLAYSNGRVRRVIDTLIERRIVERADHIVVVADSELARLGEVYPEHREKMSVVRNGYDPSELPVDVGPDPRRFVIRHAGFFYGGERNPSALFSAVSVLLAEGVISAENFAVELIGTPEAEIEELIHRYSVGSVVRQIGQRPHGETLILLAQATCLLLVTHRELESLPVKFYEYCGLRRPVLALTNPGFELARILSSSLAGEVFHLDDAPGIERWLRSAVRLFETGGPSPKVPVHTALRWTRREAARQLALIFDSTLKGRSHRSHRLLERTP